MVYWKQITAVLLLILLLGCADAEPTPTATPTDTPPTPTAPATTAPTPTPTMQPSPTPIVPTLTVTDQPLDEDGAVTIEMAALPQPGWVVLKAQRDGQVAEVLGQTAVPAGVSRDVVVTVDPLNVTPTLVAMLHTDLGEEETFEFPGVDQPLTVGDAPVAEPFAVDLQLLLPSVTLEPQEVGEDGLLRVARVVAAEAGWLAIHADDDGGLGAVLGIAPVPAGGSEALMVQIQWREATPTLYAVLYADNGRANRPDLNEDDLPVLVGGELVMTTADVTLPPDVVVLDQPVIDGTITVERVISNGPGHVVVYFDDGDAPGLIIGSEFIEDGLNKQIVIDIVETAVTPQLYIFIHDDTTPGDNFDFPANDPPRQYDGRVIPPFPFSTTPGNYLTTTDQSLSDDGTVTVPLVVVDVPAWIAVHTVEEGARGAQLGIAQLPPGINRDVQVSIDADAATETLQAVLYLDAGEIGAYEPDVDVVLQRNRSVIAAPFAVRP